MAFSEQNHRWVDDVGVVLGPTLTHTPSPARHHQSVETATYRLRRRGTENDEEDSEQNTILITIARCLGSSDSDPHYIVDATWIFYDGQQAIVRKEAVKYQISPDGEYIDFVTSENSDEEPLLTIYTAGVVLGIIDEKRLPDEFLRVKALAEQKST